MAGLEPDIFPPTALHTLWGQGRLTQLLESELKMGELVLIILFYSFLLGVEN